MSGLRKLLPAAAVLLVGCAWTPVAVGAMTRGGAGHRCRTAHGVHARKRHQCRTRAHITHRHRLSTRPESARRPATSAYPTGRSAVAGRRARRSRTHSSRQPTTTVTVSQPAGASSIASVPVTICQNTELTPEPGNLEQIRAATLCLVNQERARNGELPLQLDSRLAQAAQRHSEAMVSEDYFAHVAANGETPVERVQATGYIPNPQAGYTLGENLAWGTLQLATPSAIVAAWIASPEHRANILTNVYRDTAIGVVAAAPPSLAAGQAGAVYTQEFGVITG